MSADSGVQFVAARPRKRPHQMSSSENPNWRQNGGPSSSRTPNPSHPRSWLPPIRFPGDGLDFRQPVMSASPHIEDVIDLTNEPDSPEQHVSRPPRLPRFGRNIMADVVDLEEEDEPEQDNHQEPPSSPEVQFVGATVRPPESRRPPEIRRRPESQNRSLRQDVLHTLRFGTPRMSSHAMSDEIFRREFTWRAREIARRQPHDIDTFWIGGGSGGAIDLTINMDVDGPLGMDYQVEVPDHRGQHPSSYKPPSPAPEGFTRTAGEDDVVVCPNCDEELGIGDEIKRQIWVAKPCGHVYCGECAKNRSLSKAKKTSRKTKPFSKCPVVDCGKPVSAQKSVFQIYL